ncbi:MAG: carbon storage regulator CsrA [Sandaracinaceae bacterium]|nr:carbon storage regulator CsrA [Sandaracinaceae bacterium]
MLTLTRREGESIAIGDDIEITIVDVGRGKVRVGIVAPRNLAILRSEVLSRIVEENQRAAGALSPNHDDSAEAGRITFANGLPGLRDHHAFILAEVPGYPALRGLVSESDPLVRLLVCDAAQAMPAFPLALARDRAGLGEEEVAVAVVLTLPRDGRPPSVNLLAPLVIGLTTRRGEQVILDGTGLSARQELGGGAEQVLAAG